MATSSAFITLLHPLAQEYIQQQKSPLYIKELIYQLLFGTNIYSASSGIVILACYDGANGYSLHIDDGKLVFIYGHISPNYLVSVRGNRN